MRHREIRDPAVAREFVLGGLKLIRSAPLTVELLQKAIYWLQDLAEADSALPVSGFAVDVGVAVLDGKQPPVALPGHQFDPTMLRRYEDYVLGKFYADFTMERAADALHRYVDGDRVRALTYLINRIVARADIPGVTLSPAVVRNLAAIPMDELLVEVEQTPIPDVVLEMTNELIEQVQNQGDLVGSDDIFELEHGTAISQFGQRLALRQALAGINELTLRLPSQKIKPKVRRHAVATRIEDEDLYPIGGYSSISNRGSIESLLHSELAYMDDDRPDLFDVKWVRGELLFFSRDENQFHRQRRTYVIALADNLVRARMKDATLPWQRIVMAVAAIVVTVRKLRDWLADDALDFRIVTLNTDSNNDLTDEVDLLRTLLATEIEAGVVTFESMGRNQLAGFADSFTKRTQTSLLILSHQKVNAKCKHADVFVLQTNRLRPKLTDASGDELISEGNDSGLDNWSDVVLELLRDWVG